MSLFRSLLRVQHLSPITRATRTFSQTASNSIAKMTILGRLGAPPELVTSEKGDMVRYSVATNYGPGRTKTSWFKVAYFPRNNSSERIKEMVMSLQKGSFVLVEGDATMNKFEDPEGKTVTHLRIVQRHIELLDKRSDHALPEEDDSQGMSAEEEGENEAKEGSQTA